MEWSTRRGEDGTARRMGETGEEEERNRDRKDKGRERTMIDNN